MRNPSTRRLERKIEALTALVFVLVALVAINLAISGAFELRYQKAKDVITEVLTP